MDVKQAAELRKEFPRAAVGRLPKGGVMLDYVGHAAVTDRLLQVDPEWSWEPFAVTAEGLPALDRSGNLWIRLTIAGVTRIGVGDGKSAKEVVGDAIRNAAMRFGVALDLWAKEDLQAMHDAEPGTQAAPPPAEPPRTVQRPGRDTPTVKPAGKMTASTRATMFGLFSDLNLDETAQKAGIGVVLKLGGPIASRADLTEEQAQVVVRALRERKAAARTPLPDEPTLEEPPGWGDPA